MNCSLEDLLISRKIANNFSKIFKLNPSEYLRHYQRMLNFYLFRLIIFKF